MYRRICHPWFLLCAVTTLLAARAGVGQPCPWPEESSERLLAWDLGPVSVVGQSVGAIAARLVGQYNVPLSFIESEGEAKINLDLAHATVRRVLDKIVQSAPEYRYVDIAGRLLLYPRDAKWDTRLEGLKLGPGSRVQVASQLVDELKRRVPVFAGLGHPGIVGNPQSYVYQDVVSVAGSGSVVELLIQLLGVRPSEVFTIVKQRWGAPALWVSSAHSLRSLAVTAPVKALRRGEQAQLKVIGTLQDATRKDLTSSACLTVYSVGDEKVLAVSPDGVLTARGRGEAWVKAQNEDRFDALTIQVTDPKPSRPVSDSDGITLPGASATAVVQLLRRQDCSPVSFIAAAGGGSVSLNLRGATVAEVLRRIAAQDPAYRAETIAGREVLYPAAPEFQVALSGIDIASTSRLDAAYRYLDRLGRDLPAFSTLAPPMVIGDSRHPIFSEKVTLRPTGRVIEHLVDLLGQNPALYFEFGKAMSGVPELVFDMVSCAGSQ